MNYEELVKALRCGNDGKLPCDNKECPYWVDQWHGIGLCNILKKQSDAAAAIEELRKVNCEIRELYEDAVRKLPNRGEWISVNPMVDSVQCSVCGGQLFSAELETPYCQYCGAKMEVQDGQD